MQQIYLYLIKSYVGSDIFSIVHSAIYPWDTKANIKSCSKSVQLTGTFPVDDEILFKGSFITKITPQLEQIINEKSKRKRGEQINININSKLITDDDFLNEINEYIMDTKKHEHLAFEYYSGDYVQAIPQICKRTKNNCYFLSTIPSFIDENLQVHTFKNICF